LGFQIPPIFCITQRALEPPSKRILKKIFGFSDPANFLHQPASYAPSKRILKKYLGFQIPPIFCISQLASSGASLKKNLKKIFGFSDPANFLHQPAS